MKEFIIRLESDSAKCAPLTCECNKIYMHLKVTATTPVRTTVTAPGDNLIVGTISRIKYLGFTNSAGKHLWDYTISYDEAQLVGEDPSISSCDVEVLCCEDCTFQSLNKIRARENDENLNNIAAQVLSNTATVDVDISLAAGSPYELNTLTLSLTNSSAYYSKDVLVQVAYEDALVVTAAGGWDFSILKDAGAVVTIPVAPAANTTKNNILAYSEIITVAADTTVSAIYSVEAAVTTPVLVGEALVDTSALFVSAIPV